MRCLLQAGLSVILALAWVAGAEAQSRGRQVTPLRASAPAASRNMRGAQFQAVSGATSSDIVFFSDAAFLAVHPIPAWTFPVPGLGFDFAHLAATTRNLRVSDISVLTTAQRLALARSLAPVLPLTGAILPAPAQVIFVQQPPVVVVQQPAAEESFEPRGRSAEPQAAAPPARASEPTADVGEFVLVRRNGSIVFAVAFSAEGDHLTYITREGVRRSMALSELDGDATRRMNEERGTSIHLPV